MAAEGAQSLIQCVVNKVFSSFSVGECNDEATFGAMSNALLEREKSRKPFRNGEAGRDSGFSVRCSMEQGHLLQKACEHAPSTCEIEQARYQFSQKFTFELKFNYCYILQGIAVVGFVLILAISPDLLETPKI